MNDIKTLNYEEFCASFDYTSIPRDVNEKEIEKFDLRYYGGTLKQPSIETSTIVWSAAMTKTDPIYRLYNAGTNYLLILRYNWNSDEWKKIELNEVNNVYGLLWLMCLEIEKYKGRCKEI
jgi:hypothetical protein